MERSSTNTSLGFQKAIEKTVYGRWTLLNKQPSSRYWLAACECGTIKGVELSNLKSGKSLSCGCLAKILISNKNSTHRLSHTRVHNAWVRMHQRCKNKNTDGFIYYGGRGIKVCERWGSFDNFLLDMGEPKDGHSLDRIDVNGDYSHENCRWASKTTQNRNTRKNHFVEYGGELLTLAEWGERFGISPITICKRLKRGWTAAQALTLPNRTRL